VQTKIVINSTNAETRIALLEDSKLKEIYIERNQKPSLVGNIYLAKVSRVIPGIQSSFIDIGQDNTAFLFGGDVLNTELIAARQKEIDSSKEQDYDQKRKHLPNQNIEKLLTPGQSIPVQITKDPLGSKGARATMDLSVAGRFLVLTPFFHHIGISRRITDDLLREKLKETVSAVAPLDAGFIIRTAAAEATPEQLKNDVQYLINKWQHIQQKIKNLSEPQLIYSDHSIHTRIIRDIFHEGTKIETDNHIVYDELKEFFSAINMDSDNILTLHKEDQLIFDKHDIEPQISNALKAKVWLPSGGYLIIDHTEALCAFDVNTGKFTGNNSARDTILRTNLEAAEEVVSQLRLRNIGGIVVIDFIDMDYPDDQDQIVDKLSGELAHDKARTNVLSISELGLLQMTRKRTSDPLLTMMSQNCPHCLGKGVVQSYPTLATELFREIKRYCYKHSPKDLNIEIRDDLLAWLNENFEQHLEKLKNDFKVEIIFQLSKVKYKDLGKDVYQIIQ